MQISNRMDLLQPSPTIAISNLARDLKAEGKDIISLSAGEPDFNTPKEIIDSAHEAALEGQTKYAATTGILPLREAIKNKMKKDNNLDYSVDEIFVGSGAKQVLFNVFLAILNPGDEVIIPSPYWVSYIDQVKFAEGTPVVAKTTSKTNYKLTPEILDDHVTNKTKILILNSPNNPTGVIYSKEELKALANYLEDKDIIVVSDEIYEVLVYEGEHYSIAEMSDKMKQNTVVVNGVSKSHAMTGWRIGYACGDKSLIKAMAKLQSQSISSVTTPAQFAAIKAYNLDDSYLKDYNKTFKNRRNNAYKEIQKIPYITCVEPTGAFYLFPDVKELVQKCNFENVDVFVEALLKEKHIALVPGSAFGSDDNLRISYALSEDKFNEAMRRLKEFVEEHLNN